MTNRELHNLELYYAGCRNAKRDLEKFGEKCCLKVIDTFTSEELKEISFEKGYLDGFNDYRKGETTMENKLTAIGLKENDALDRGLITKSQYCEEIEKALEGLL